MKIIILDFTDLKVKVIDNIEESLQIEDVEEIITNRFDFSLSNIEYMTVPELIIENIN